MTLITSPANPKIKLIRSLRQRKQREAAGLYLVEGIHPVGEAVQAGVPLEALVYAPELLTSGFARELVQSQEAAGLPCYLASAAVFASIADKENPQGLLAVARWRPPRLESLAPANFPWGVGLVSPQDPGNVGAILRTLDAVGASGLLLLESSVDPTHPSLVRASMGALFWKPVVQASFAEFQAWAAGLGYTVYGTSAHASLDYRQAAAYRRPMILLLGSERQGLTAEQAAACAEMIRLPMHGRASSLNLAVAAGVLLYAMLEKLAPWQP
jgi:TrmH family RNA methyltransferase